MVKWSAIALIALGIVHMLVLGADIPAELPNWLSLNLWTWDHWVPLRTQPLDLALSGGVFWQSVGSLAIPLLILGALILWLDRRSLPIPVFVGWGLLVWTAIMTAIMPPSGLTVVFVVSVFLTVGLQVRSRKRGNSPAA